MSNGDEIVDSVINDADEVMSLDGSEIEECLERAVSILEEEKTLVELDGDVVFVGDTHGDFETTKAVVERFFDADHLVFLGDYIDREPVQWGSIYNLTYLLLLKCRFPEKIILLKGNHECNYVISCFPYEFDTEVTQKYGSPSLHPKYVEAFSCMPLMVLVKNVFAAHSGFLKKGDLTTLRNIGKNDLEAIKFIAWSDPAISKVFRGVGEPFTEEDIAQFLERIGAKVFVRGHDYTTLGFSIYGDRCVTIFSSRMYKDMGNGGILVVRTNGDVFHASDLLLWDFSTGKWIKYNVVKR